MPKSKSQKRKEAEERQRAHDALSLDQKIEKAQQWAGVHSARELDRLLALKAKQPQPVEKEVES